MVNANVTRTPMGTIGDRTLVPCKSNTTCQTKNSLKLTINTQKLKQFIGQGNTSHDANVKCRLGNDILLLNGQEFSKSIIFTLNYLENCHKCAVHFSSKHSDEQIKCFQNIILIGLTLKCKNVQWINHIILFSCYAIHISL